MVLEVVSPLVFFRFMVPVFSLCSYTVVASELEVVEDCCRRAVVCMAAGGGAAWPVGEAVRVELEAPTNAGAVAVARAVCAAAVTTVAGVGDGAGWELVSWVGRLQLWSGWAAVSPAG